MSVPPTAALRTHPGDTPPPLLQPHLTSSGATAWSNLPWYVRLALRLCVEQKLGSSSEYAAAVAVLPDVVDLPVIWSEEEVLQLQCPHMIQMVGAKGEM